MEFNFDWNCVSAGAPYVTIGKTGIAFNLPAINLLGNPDRIAIGFDSKNMAIGVRQAEAEEKTKTYDFMAKLKNGWVRIGCRDFVKYLSSLSGISFEKAVRFHPNYDQKQGLMYIIVKRDE